MVGILNRVGSVIVDSGTGDVTADTPISNTFNLPGDAGAVNGQPYWWSLEKGTDVQIFSGVWNSTTKKVSRTTTLFSRIDGVLGTANVPLDPGSATATLKSTMPAEALLGFLTLAGGTFTGPVALAADPTSAMQAVTKQYADNLIAAADALVWKGVIDCSGNPNYPAANAGWTYRVSVAGKIGGASGVNVEAGDLLVCNVDGTASGNQATVGAAWSVVQTNIDGFATAVRDQINAASSKATPVDADVVGGLDSAASFGLVKFTWANIKAFFKTTAANIWAGTNDALFMTAKNAADSSAWVSLTSSTAIATDASAGYNFFITLAHNTTLGAPTNLIDGRTYQWLIQQDATGGRTSAFNAIFEFTAVPTLSTAAGKRDLIVGTYHAASGKIIASFRKGS